MRAKKKYGQNFLNDLEFINKIIMAIKPKKDDLVLEIGPGLGAITIPMLKHTKHITAIEIDQDMIDQLMKKIPNEKITIYNEDFLKSNSLKFNSYTHIIGNLPYYISSAILMKIAKLPDCNAELHFMLQKEVAERITANTSTKAYGRLSVILQYFYQTEYLFEIPAQSFTPAPKITSAFVRLTRKPQVELLAKNIDTLEKVIKTAFQQKRKTLKNNFKGILDEKDFLNLSISSNLRAESISVGDFIKIENYFYKEKLSF